MDEQKIQEIERNLMQQYVTEPLILDALIDSISKDAARKLVLSINGVAEFEFLGDPFIARGKRVIQSGKQCIYLVISNEETRRIAGSHYIPFTVTAEIDNNFTLIENYEAIIQTFLKHVSNTERPEVIDD